MKRPSIFAVIAGYEIFVEVDDHDHYIIMTRVLGVDANAFQPLTEICNSFTVVRFDWPGMGHSSLDSKTDIKITMPSPVDLLQGVVGAQDSRSLTPMLDKLIPYLPERYIDQKAPHFPFHAASLF